ncbi:MAG TPA: recombinase RecT [Candidatus Rifleibacterium sp.]|nr:recombinase RecT [Candidatus Rifleibacterium sp.]
MTNLPAVKNPRNNIRALLEKSKAQIAMALPKHLTADRIIRVAMTSIQRTPKLLDCDPKSLIGAIIQSAQLGLEPDGVLGHAYLIPYGNQVQFIPGYKGLIDLARRSGQVVSIGSHVVYSNEKFSLKFGFDETLEHEPLAPSQRGDRKGVYAVARLKDGSVHFEWLWSEEVEAVKTQSLKKMKKPSGPWIDNEDEMWRKTAIRRLAKYLPLSVEFAKAAAVDELADAGISTQEYFDDSIKVSASPARSIDDAFSEIAEENPETEEKPEITQQKSEEVTEKSTESNQVSSVNEQIDAYQINPGPMTAYVVRALGGNKPRNQWSEEESQKVLAEIKKTKGEK